MFNVLKPLEVVHDAELQLEKLKFQWQMNFCNLMEDIFSVINVQTKNNFQLVEQELQLIITVTALLDFLKFKAFPFALTATLLRLGVEPVGLIDTNLKVLYVKLVKLIIINKVPIII